MQQKRFLTQEVSRLEPRLIELELSVRRQEEKLDNLDINLNDLLFDLGNETTDTFGDHYAQDYAPERDQFAHEFKSVRTTWSKDMTAHRKARDDWFKAVHRAMANHGKASLHSGAIQKPTRFGFEESDFVQFLASQSKPEGTLTAWLHN
jgi:hypothetical protein